MIPALLLAAVAQLVPMPAEPIRVQSALFDSVWTKIHERIFAPDSVRAALTLDRYRVLRNACALAPDVEALADSLNPFLDGLGVSHLQIFTRNDPAFAVLHSIGRDSLNAVPSRHIGAQYQRVQSRWVIRATLEGYPAAVAGLRRGDVVVSANGRAFDPRRAFVDRDPVVLRIERNGAPQSVRIAPIQESFHASLLEAMRRSVRVFTSGAHRIGYVHLWACTSPRFERLLKRAVLEDFAGADAIILDLRDGFGGWWAEYADAFFADRSSYVSLHRSDGSGEHDAERGTVPEHPYTRKPLVVVINEGTRSGREGLAFELRATGRARLVGATTAGAFVGAETIRFAGWPDVLLYAPINRFLLGGAQLEGHGVEPDRRVAYPLDRSLPNDPQYDAAVEEMVKRLTSPVDRQRKWR